MKTRLALAAAIAGLLAAPLPALAQSAPGWASPTTMPNPGVVQPGRAPIREALLKIIPPPYKVQLDSRIPASTEVVWHGSTDWMYALRQALTPMGYRVEPDWATSTIRILAPVAVASTAPAAPAVTQAAPRLAVTHGVNGSAYIGKAMPAPTEGTRGFAATVPGVPHPMTPVPGTQPATYAAHDGTPVAPKHAAPAEVSVTHTPLLTTTAPAFSHDAPAAPTAVGAAYTIPAHVRLAQGLAKYVARFGWTLKWELPRTYVTAAPFPIPALSLQAGLTYVLQAYQAQGDLAGATFALAVPNHIAVARSATATESSP
ncbi:MAG TPA: hypothetical protein VF292_08525 [Rhodanobacteraceae bacterium]